MPDTSSSEPRPVDDPADTAADVAALDPVADAIYHELYFGGPKMVDELVAALADQGFDLSDREIEDMLDVGDVPLVVGLGFDEHALYVALDGLLAERVFTHRLTATEIELDLLTCEPDFSAVMPLTEWAPFDAFDDGTPFEELFDGVGVDGGGALQLPGGSLAGYQPGDLIAIVVSVTGLHLVAVHNLAEPAAELRARVQDQFTTPDGVQPQMLSDLIVQLCLSDLLLFTDPLPPLADLLTDWGLERSIDVVAPTGFDVDGWRAGRRRQEVAASYNLDERQTAALLVVSDAVRQVLRQDERRDRDDDPMSTKPADELVLSLPPAPPELADPLVADAVWWESLGVTASGAAALSSVVEAWEPTAPRKVRPSLAWLRGKTLEQLGEVLTAEAAFEEALALEPTFDNALVDLSRYADDRGDAPRAISLLERAGFTDEDPMVAELRAYVPVERQDVGRNDACHCGSGRKYKRCHLGRADLTPHQQTVWLYSKAVRFALDAPHADLLFELAAVRAEYLSVELHAAVHDPTVLDVALFDGGLLAAFLRVRGVLIPERERLQATSWLLVDRSVFEVTAVNTGHSVTVQDLRSGDSAEVADIKLSRSVHPGDLVTTRLLPVGEGVEIHGGVEPVPLHLLDHTLEVLDRQNDAQPDPVEMVSVLSARFTPPRLMSSDGDPIVLCTGELQVTPGAIDDVVSLFDSRFESANDPADPRQSAEPRRWMYAVPGSTGDRILSMLHLSDTHLLVQSSTEERFDEVLAMVRGADPAIRVTTETRIPPSQMPTPPTHSTAHGSSADPVDPATAAVLRHVTAEYEQQWLDMEIPALSGLTPRQAAVDPTRREDLLRLLTSFDRMGPNPGTMDVASLRRALEL